MRFATSFYQTGEMRETVQELRFPFQALNAAIEYASSNPDKKVIVEHKNLTKEDKAYVPFNKMYDLQVELNNLYYDFYDFGTMREYAKYSMNKNYAICHYMLHTDATNWGLVQILLYYHVSDISVTEPLTFQLNNLAALRERGVCVRAKPHQPATIADIKNDSGIKHFWVLPQHIGFYEHAIDVFDLTSSNHKAEETLINEYIIKKKFESNLTKLFPSLKVDYAASIIDDKWMQRRMNCGQRCLEVPSKCNHCEQMIKYYDLIKNKTT